MGEVALLPGERIDQLAPAGIRIIQHPHVFAFSLDAVLLAAFAQLPKRGGQVVDLGAGNGAVSLFAAHHTTAQMTLVEIQPRLADMARRSIVLNDLTQRLTVLNMPMQEILTEIPKDSVDAVMTNPPYFKDSPTIEKKSNPHFALARHELTVTLTEVVALSADLLKFNGKLFMVHRPDRLGEILSELQAHQLAPKRLRFVYPKAGREANMVLIEAIRGGRPNGLRVLPPLVVYDEQGNYEAEVKRALFTD